MRKLLASTLPILVGLMIVPGARADDDKEMQALLDKVIAAHGGAMNLDKNPAMSMKLKGKVNVMNLSIDFTGEWSAQMPDKLRTELDIEVMGNKIKIITVVNKDKGWISAANMTMEMDKDMVKEAREEMHSGFTAGKFTPLKGKDYKLSSLGEAMVDGKPAIGIRVSHKSFRDINMFFDKKSHLLVKSESRSKDFNQGGQEVTKEVLYGDYKAVQGVQTPHKVAIKQDGKDFLTAEVTEVQLLDKLGDDLFGKP